MTYKTILKRPISNRRGFVSQIKLTLELKINKGTPVQLVEIFDIQKFTKTEQPNMRGKSIHFNKTIGMSCDFERGSIINTSP